MVKEYAEILAPAITDVLLSSIGDEFNITLLAIERLLKRESWTKKGINKCSFLYLFLLLFLKLLSLKEKTKARMFMTVQVRTQERKTNADSLVLMMREYR